jgi:hypothetical protein
MAPASGADTRRAIGDRAREGRNRAEDVARQGRDFISRQKETFASAIERGREAYNQARGTGAAPEAPGAGPAPERPEPL